MARLNRRYPRWLNFLLFQALWFAAILGREPLEWLVALLLAVHFMLVSDLKNELRLVLICAAIGATVDTALTLSGLLIFDPAPWLLPIPFWLLGLWIGFAATFRHSMSYLLARPMIAIPAAMIAAPFSYAAGMSLGAVRFGLEIMPMSLLIGVTWTCLIALFIRIERALPRDMIERT